MKSLTPLIIVLLLYGKGLCSQEKPLDFWAEELRTIATAPAGKHVDCNLDKQRHPNYSAAHFQLDHTDKQVGDLSLVYLPGRAKGAKKVGFVANLWGGKWKLSKQMALKLHLKTTGDANPDSWQVVLVDVPGKTATATLKGTNTKGEWRELVLPLSELKAGEGFEWSSVRLCEFEADFGANSEVRFDGVCFQDAGNFLGVTDKPVSQRMAEAEANREFIIQAGRKADYSTLDAFMAVVLDNPIALYKTVVPGFHILAYTGNGKDAPEIVFNAGTADIPTVGGEYVNYAFPKTFDSPHIQSEYKSGRVNIQFGGDVLNLDFTDKPRCKAR